MEEVINDNATNINNIGKYDSENNSMNGESISNFDRSTFYEERDSYYLLIDLDILENVIMISSRNVRQKVVPAK